MLKLNAGELRHPITIQKAVDADNAFGEPIPTWESYARVWAKVEPLTGRELAMYKSQGGIETHRITIRYYPGLAVTDQIVEIDSTPSGISYFAADYFGPMFGGEYFDTYVPTVTHTYRINSISNVENRNYALILMATEALHP